MKLNKESTFYRFLSLSDDNKFDLYRSEAGYGTMSVCDMPWMVCKSAGFCVFAFLVGMAASSAALYAVADAIAFAAAFIMYGWVIPDPGAIVTMLVVLAFLLSLLVALPCFDASKMSDSHLWQVYSAWKEKRCSKVEIVG